MNKNEHLAELSVEELYRLVWEKPVQVLSKEFGISDVGLAKICKRHNIPRPERGYWAKLYAGLKTQKPPLPKSADRNATISITKTERVGLSVEKKELASKIIVHDSLFHPHPLVEIARRNMEFSKYDSERSRSPKNIRCLNIRTTKETFERALCIMDAVIKALEQAGLFVKIDTQGVTKIVVAETEIDLLIREPLRMVKTKFDPQKDGFEISIGRQYRVNNLPSGKLSLELGGKAGYGIRSTWRDTNKSTLESSLTGFIEAAQKYAIAKRKHHAEVEKWRHECRENERHRHEESLKDSKLKEQLAMFTQCETLRKYADCLREGIITATGKEPEGEAAEWIDWIKRRASHCDIVTAFVDKYAFNMASDEKSRQDA